MAKQDTEIEFSSKIAYYITALKQLSQRCIFGNASEIEKNFYIQQIKNIFSQILQPVFDIQQQNFDQANTNKNETAINLSEQVAKVMFDTNFALQIVLQESVINHKNEAYIENENLIIGQLESSIQSIDFVDIDKQQCQLVTVALPILSWSSYDLPKGNISNAQCKKIAKILRDTVASKENKAVLLTNYLFDKNEIPDSYLSAAQLTQSLLNSYLIMRESSPEKTKKLSKENSIFVAEICRTEDVEIINESPEEFNNDNYNDNYIDDDDVSDDNIVYVDVDSEQCNNANDRDLSEVKFLLAAFIIPKNAPLFSWMNINKKTDLLFQRDTIYEKWYKKIMPVMKDVFIGCDFQTLLPETLFNAMELALKISRRYGLESLLKYLRSIIGIIPTQLSVLIGGFYYFENSNSNKNKSGISKEEREVLKEFRLSFKVRGSSQILCGYTWKLLENSFADGSNNTNVNTNADIKEEENLSDIMEILKENNILDIHFIDNHFAYCLCQNCQQRLYINDDNELIHPKFPDYLVFNKPN